MVDLVGPGQLEEVINRARRLDPDAYDALVDAYGQRLFGFLYRLTGDRHEAEDLLQEVFLRLVQMLPKYEHRGRFEGWLFAIAANLGRDRIRRLRRAPRIVSMSGSSDSTDDDADGTERDCDDRDTGAPDRPLMHREAVDQLQRALNRLPEAEREVVMLRHYSAMSFAEIAEAMGTPLGTALARGHRGLAKLRRMMETES